VVIKRKKYWHQKVFKERFLYLSLKKLSETEIGDANLKAFYYGLTLKSLLVLVLQAFMAHNESFITWLEDYLISEGKLSKDNLFAAKLQEEEAKKVEKKVSTRTNLNDFDIKERS